MGRHTENKQVVKNLQDALEAYLKDQRLSAESDPEWIEQTKEMSPEELEAEAGCGCEDCKIAGQLLGAIY